MQNIKLMDTKNIKFTYDVFEKFKETVDNTELKLDEYQRIYFRFSADRIRDIFEEYELLALFDYGSYPTTACIITDNSGYQCEVLLDIRNLARMYFNEKYPNKFKVREVYIDRGYNINFEILCEAK